MHLQNTYNYLHLHMPGHELHLIVKERLSRDRLQQGWEEPPVIGMNLHASPNHTEALAIVSEPGNIHIFEGISPKLWGNYIRPAKHHHSLVLVMTECPDLRGMKRPLRYSLSYFYEKQRLKEVDYVLHIGENARQWYHQYCGFQSTHLVPFLYTVAPPALTPDGPDTPDRPITVNLCENSLDLHQSQNVLQPFKLIFVGSLINRKGIDLLLKSLHSIQLPWSLEIIGAGPEREKLESFVQRAQLSSQVTFRGTLPNATIRKLLRQYDLLVLPSHYDGWGCVVNEALMAGTPVVCSSNCGAADLFAKGSCLGSVFENGSFHSLASHLRRAIEQGKPTMEQRASIQMWADNIHGATIAAYLAHFLLSRADRQDEAPTIPPWKTPILPIQ